MKNNLFNRSGIWGIILAVLWPVAAHAGNDDSNLKLKYNRPATYFEEALVIGNGTMGAIVYGGQDKDVISLNDITLWTGEPDREVTTPDAYKAIPEIRALLEKEDYRAADRKQRKVQGHYSENYQPLGRLNITYLGRSASVKNYERVLDISQAIAKTTYEVGEKPFECDYFANVGKIIELSKCFDDKNSFFLHKTAQFKFVG